MNSKELSKLNKIKKTDIVELLKDRDLEIEGVLS